MKRRLFFSLALLLAVAIPAWTLMQAKPSVLGAGPAQAVLAAGLQAPAGQDTPFDDSNPRPQPQVQIPPAYRTGATAVSGAAAAVYFTPMDENESTTVLFLYNTGTMTATVGIETFELDGDPFIDTTMQVPANGLVRLAADPTDGEGSATWEDVAFVNFTTFSTYGRLTLPEGVKASGYIAWNNGSTYEPRTPVPVLNLDFSSDPPSVFLPLTRAE